MFRDEDDNLYVVHKEYTYVTRDSSLYNTYDDYYDEYGYDDCEVDRWGKSFYDGRRRELEKLDRVFADTKRLVDRYFPMIRYSQGIADRRNQWYVGAFHDV